MGMNAIVILTIVGLLHGGSAQSSSSTTTTTASPGATTTTATVGGTAAGCIAYASACSNSNTCCYYPSILCLPDVRNGTSCLLVLDVVNLSPSITGANFGPLVTGMGAAPSGIGAVQEIVQVNGNTVYNETEIITPSTTEAGGSTPSLG